MNNISEPSNATCVLCLSDDCKNNHCPICKNKRCGETKIGMCFPCKEYIYDKLVVGMNVEDEILPLIYPFLNDGGILDKNFLDSIMSTVLTEKWKRTVNGCTLGSYRYEYLDDDKRKTALVLHNIRGFVDWLIKWTNETFDYEYEDIIYEDEKVTIDGHMFYKLIYDYGNVYLILDYMLATYFYTGCYCAELEEECECSGDDSDCDCDKTCDYCIEEDIGDKFMGDPYEKLRSIQIEPISNTKSAKKY